MSDEAAAGEPSPHSVPSAPRVGLARGSDLAMLQSALGAMIEADPRARAALQHLGGRLAVSLVRPSCPPGASLGGLLGQQHLNPLCDHTFLTSVPEVGGQQAASSGGGQEQAAAAPCPAGWQRRGSGSSQGGSCPADAVDCRPDLRLDLSSLAAAAAAVGRLPSGGGGGARPLGPGRTPRRASMPACGPAHTPRQVVAGQYSARSTPRYPLALPTHRLGAAPPAAVRVAGQQEGGEGGDGFQAAAAEVAAAAAARDQAHAAAAAMMLAAAIAVGSSQATRKAQVALWKSVPGGGAAAGAPPGALGAGRARRTSVDAQPSHPPSLEALRSQMAGSMHKLGGLAGGRPAAAESAAASRGANSRPGTTLGRRDARQSRGGSDDAASG